MHDDILSSVNWTFFAECYENRVELLFCSSTALKHSEVRQPACVAVTVYVTDTDATRLRQRNHVWCSWRAPAEPSPVRSQCSCAPCLSRAEVWPRHSSDSWPALVAGSGENTLPTGRACLPLSSQHGASVPRPWPALDWRGRSATTSTFRLSPTTGLRSSHDWRPFLPCDGGTVMEQFPPSVTSASLLTVFK